MKYLLSFNVGSRNKFSNTLDDYDDNNRENVEDMQEYEDDMINNGIEDL